MSHPIPPPCVCTHVLVHVYTSDPAPHPPQLLEWIAPQLELSLEALVEGFALLSRARVPPVELMDPSLSLVESGVGGGTLLLLEPRISVPTPSAVRRRRPVRYRPKKPQAQPSSEIALPGGLIGHLCGSYTVANGPWNQAGMLLLVVEHSLEGNVLMQSLLPHLHFLSLGFELTRCGAPPVHPPGSIYLPSVSARAAQSLEGGAEQLYEICQFIARQHPALFLRGIVAHGAAADAAYVYAKKYGHTASCPTRQLVLVGGGHVDMEPLGADWCVLSVLGTADAQASLMRAELFHAKHRAGGHKLRVLEGGTHDFGAHIKQLGGSINDWFEGARRLTDEDMARWHHADDASSSSGHAAEGHRGGGHMSDGGKESEGVPLARGVGAKARHGESEGDTEEPFDMI